MTGSQRKFDLISQSELSLSIFAQKGNWFYKAHPFSWEFFFRKLSNTFENIELRKNLWLKCKLKLFCSAFCATLLVSIYWFAKIWGFLVPESYQGVRWSGLQREMSSGPDFCHQKSDFFCHQKYDFCIQKLINVDINNQYDHIPKHIKGSSLIFMWNSESYL